MSEATVFTASCIVSREDRIIRDGAIVADAGRILDVGTEKDILARWQGCRSIRLNNVLLPPLVNCHIHLELSHLENIARPESGKGMVGWIKEVLKQRDNSKFSSNQIAVQMAEALVRQETSGVGLIANIGNISSLFQGLGDAKTEVINILEMLGPTRRRTQEGKEALKSFAASQLVSPHAAYSTSAELIQILKGRARENGQLFSIHVAESAAEVDFIRNRRGLFRDLLEEMGSWEDGITGNVSSDGVVHYLDALAVLDEKTLCVHCVHIDDEEINLLVRRKAGVCICPGSNEFLHSGKPPLEKMLAQGLLPGIGTDSAASNPELDIWREMKLIKKNHPEISAAAIFAMATRGGAQALGRGKDYGSLEEGKKAVMLEVVIENQAELSDSQLLNTLATRGRPEHARLVKSENMIS